MSIPGRNSTAAVLVKIGSVVVLVLVNVPGFRPVLARGWHDQPPRPRNWRWPLRPEGSATRAWPPLLPRVPGDHCPLESARVRPRPDGLSLSWSLNPCPERPARPWPSGCKPQARARSRRATAASGRRLRSCMRAVVRRRCCTSCCMGLTFTCRQHGEPSTAVVIVASAECSYSRAMHQGVESGDGYGGACGVQQTVAG